MLESLYRHPGWAIGLIRAPIASLLDGATRATIEWLPLSKTHTFFADPFLIEDRGTIYCFFEELDYRTNRGKISYVVPGASSAPLNARTAIERPFHLSYPFLLRYEDEVLCIPEAGESGSITVYAARGFPDGWYERATLLEGFPGVDPTLFQHGGRWWLFCTNGGGGWNSDLYAWYADDLFGRWRPHSSNPIKRDLSSGRPGGTPFVHEGRLYRPAQDCSTRYGGGITLCEIVELTPERFSERVAGRLIADPAGRFPDGLHTASGCNQFTAVDGNRLYFEPYQTARAVSLHAQKILRRVTARR